MSGIFGLFRRDGAPVLASEMQTMREAMSHWGSDGGGVMIRGAVGFGQLLFASTPESAYEILPHEKIPGIVFTAAARVDNRADLIRDCPTQLAELSSRSPRRESGNAAGVITDSDLIACAYMKWGQDCPGHIYGDWSFAAWHPAERKLFLARDHFGNTSLYYHIDERVFAFASDIQALLDLNLTPVAMDELYLAQVLVSWPAYHGERTIHSPLKRLPPAHSLCVTCDRVEIDQYWFLEQTPILRLPHRNDYVEAFREVFDKAVRCRLREPDMPSVQSASGAGRSRVGTTLSGGLDSSSVTATAAAFLRERGMILPAYTSVPLYDTKPYVGKNFGDEFPFAQATAKMAGNVDLLPIKAQGISPIKAICDGLNIHHEPGHAAGNLYWMHDLERTAHDQGCRILLTGQLGNAGLSWTGDIFSQVLAFQIRKLGWRKWAQEAARQNAPEWLLDSLRNLNRGWQARMNPAKGDCIHALRSDVAARLRVEELRKQDSRENRAHTAVEKRLWMKPGRSFVGALHAQHGAAHGLEIRDPTGDARLLAFCFGVPDEFYMDPASGQNRWLIRSAMEGRLPDEVRLNRSRGRQAGDLVPRLRVSAHEVEEALSAIECGAGSEYVDIERMRKVWSSIQREDSPESFRTAVTVLTRGIMAGLFVNRLHSSVLQ